MTLLQNSISSHVAHTFKPNSVYSFQIICKILDITHINGSFSLTQLLAMS